MQIKDIDFIENYILVNGEHIRLYDYQRKFIKWLTNLKNKHHENKSTN